MDQQKDQYGPGNPEPGGDGTNGVDTKEIVALIKKCKRVLEFRRGTLPDNIFEQGDLVYDKRNKEHGVVLGEKPEVWEIDTQITPVPLERRSRTYIVLTITTDENDELKTRIRYVSYKNLRSIQDSLKDKSLTDLEVFCSQQCIMECSEDCVLRKYKRTR